MATLLERPALMKTKAEFGCDRHSVHARGIRNDPDLVASFGIEDNHFGCVRNVEAACIGISGEVIPPAVIRNLPGGNLVISGAGGEE